MSKLKTWQPPNSSLHGPLPLYLFPFLSFLRQRRSHSINIY